MPRERAKHWGRRPATPRETVPEMSVEARPMTTNLLLAALLASASLARIVGIHQPIVENYVGRQIPTAMVARNLERGSGFLNPCLDVAPFPNRFLVEPPVYAACVVALQRVSGLPLEAAGRAVSALGVVIGAWGLFGLAARREGAAVAFGAVAVFATAPVSLRYGRAFQPDALMIGCLIAGLRCWDEAGERGLIRLAAGFLLIATGLALKVVSAYVLIPLALVILRGRRRWQVGLAAATLIPAVLWYGYVALSLGREAGSRASADNGAIWLSVLIPRALGRVETYQNIARFLFIRSFTPLGPVLAVVGLWLIRPRADRLWTFWGVSAVGAMALLAAKLHHEYYWLSVAPVVSVGVARTLVMLGRKGAWGGFFASASALVLLGLSFVFAASTWRTPSEWVSLREAAAAVDATVPADAWVVAPEALLFAADRRGCRLELTPAAARRAAGEWGDPFDGSGPLGLVEFYRLHGAAYFADVRPAAIEPARLALHDAVRRRYNVVMDRPGVLIARLNESAQKGRSAWPRNLRTDPPPPTTGRSPSPTSPAGNNRVVRSSF